MLILHDAAEVREAEPATAPPPILRAAWLFAAVEPCARCGTSEGRSTGRRRNPARVDGLPYDVDGPICLDCRDDRLAAGYGPDDPEPTAAEVAEIERRIAVAYAANRAGRSWTRTMAALAALDGGAPAVAARALAFAGPERGGAA